MEALVVSQGKQISKLDHKNHRNIKKKKKKQSTHEKSLMLSGLPRRPPPGRRRAGRTCLSRRAPSSSRQTTLHSHATDQKKNSYSEIRPKKMMQIAEDTHEKQRICAF